MRVRECVTHTHTHTHTHTPTHNTHTSTILPLPHHTHSTTPLTPSPKIWEVRGATDKRPLSQDHYGQFDSSKVYLIQYLHPPPSTLVVYVWVGGEVGEGEEKQVKAALQHAETMAPKAQKVHMKYMGFTKFIFSNSMYYVCQYYIIFMSVLHHMMQHHI